MSKSSRRARDCEKQAADMLRTQRKQFRGRYERAPDMASVRLSTGVLLQPECKERETAIPKWMRDGLDQASRYCPGAVPLLVVKQLGGRPLAVIDLEMFAELVGIREPRAGEQLALLGGPAT